MVHDCLAGGVLMYGGHGETQELEVSCLGSTASRAHGVSEGFEKACGACLFLSTLQLFGFDYSST